jgi:hypothetical protein
MYNRQNKNLRRKCFVSKSAEITLKKPVTDEWGYDGF